MRGRLSKGTIASLFTTGIFLAGAFLAVQNSQLIKDTVVYHQYEPTEAIAAFVEQTGMNDKGKFLFYASQPLLEDRDGFNTHCQTAEHLAAVLGCYSSERIYIYNITDPRLEGIRPTTAAHEMLHAAFERLSSTDRSKVEQLLEAEYAKLKNVAELEQRMAVYAQIQPGDRANELHSIIGTEVKTLSAELETYYERYFSDRQKVVAQYERYHSLFAELQARATQLTSQIDELGKTIEQNRRQYANQSEALERSIQEFNARAGRGDFDSQASFQRERQQLISQTTVLDGLRSQINDMIATYNSTINELNGIATETNELNRSIDSTVDPAPSLE